MGIFPESWSVAAICPLHKKGNINDPNNYRGISLLSVLGKVFTKVLSNRLTQWAEEENAIHECQAGFRKGYSTQDQIFSLQAMIQKYLSRKGGRFYCMFVDFQKAFDCVDHQYLWHKICTKGIHGKILQVLKSMYSQMKSCIRLPKSANYTNTFTCKVGTRQGCMVSPFLFCMYITDLVYLYEENACQGIYIDEQFSNITSLFYADDLANCGDTVRNLQKLADHLSSFCKRWKMRVNIDKTKVIVFRNGGYLRHYEKWFIDGVQIEVVSAYKYLGIVFTPKLSWSKAKHTLALQARKALGMFYKLCKKVGHLPHFLSFKIFDTMIKPILTYGSEIWGYEASEIVESVHVRFCKSLLMVSSSACTSAVLGECGRFPICIDYHVKCIKYWLRLLTMNHDRLPRACYNMLLELDRSGRKTWASSVKHLLYMYGFGDVWENQGCGNVEQFIAVLKQRLVDICKQDWGNSINLSDKLVTYCTFKSDLVYEKYLSVVTSSEQRRSLCTFRISNHELHIEKGRYNSTERHQRLCIMCSNKGYTYIENEEHLLKVCCQYDDLRAQYIPEIYTLTLAACMSSQNSDFLKRLAAYIYHCNKLRDTILKQLGV